MEEVKHVKKTYKEHLKEVRARQFGWTLGEPEPISAIASVSVASSSPKKHSEKETN